MRIEYIRFSVTYTLKITYSLIVLRKSFTAMHQDKVRNCSVIIYLISLYLFSYLFDNLLFYPKNPSSEKNERWTNY